MADIYLGLGSNEDAERNLALALSHLATRFTDLQCSRAYRNPPVGRCGSDFLNLVLRCRTALSVQEVKGTLREIERAASRVRDARNSDRWTLDIDLLLYGSCVDPALRLPREDVLRHAHVLCLLAEIAPCLRHPVSGRTMAAAWQEHRSAACDWIIGGRIVSTAVPASTAPIVKGESVLHAEPVPV